MTVGQVDGGLDGGRGQDALRERVKALVATHRDDRGPLLEILHDVQAEFGHVDDAVVSMIAEEMNLSRADVHGVLTFYRDLRRTPGGSTTVLVCRAEACQAVGGEALAAAVSRELGVDYGQTTPDGEVTLEAVYCLGNCALGPSAQVGGRLYGRFSTDRLAAVLADRRAERAAGAQGWERS